MSIAPVLPSSIASGLKLRCPQCGEGHLFRSYLKLADHCEACGLDYGFADPADGPAFFVMTVVGLVVTGAWGWSTVVFHPPIWLQLVTAIPAMVIGCLVLLPPMKAWLVAEQFVHKAGEGRWTSLGGHGVGGFTTDRRRADVVNVATEDWDDRAALAAARTAKAA